MTAPTGSGGVLAIDLVLAAVKQLGISDPVFIEGRRVSVPEADIARLASAVGAIAEAMEEYFSIPQLRIGDRFAAELKMRAALDRYHGGA